MKVQRYNGEPIMFTLPKSVTVEIVVRQHACPGLGTAGPWRWCREGLAAASWFCPFAGLPSCHQGRVGQ